MNKTELIKEIATVTGKTIKETTEIVNATFDVIGNTLVNGDDVKVSQFGTFKSVAVEGRTARNPKDGSEINIPAHNKVKFTVAKALKDAVK